MCQSSQQGSSDVEWEEDEGSGNEADEILLEDENVDVTVRLAYLTLFHVCVHEKSFSQF